MVGNGGNMKNKMKKIQFPCFSFLLTISLILFFLFIYKISYQDLFISDSNQQYLQFFYYLKDVLSGTESIFFSFSKGLGESMLGTVLYYLASPFNFFLIFVSKSQIPLFMQILILIKIGFSSFTMHLFLRKLYQKDGIIINIFSITYAIMGYTVNYYFNIMWLDLLYLAPLVLIGIHKIIEEKSPIFYIIFLFFSMVSNCYIAYMLCLFSALYFFYQIWIQNIKDKRKIVTIFIISSLFTAFLASFVLLPMIGELKMIYRKSAHLPKLLDNLGENVFYFFSSFFIGESLSIAGYLFPNLYFTVFNLFLFILYFGNKKIPKRERKITFLFSILLFLSYIIPFLNYIWHGLSVPVGLNYRFSFLVTLFMITISLKSFLFLEKKSKKQFFIIAILLFLVFAITTIFTHKKSDAYFFLINWFFLISYALMFFILSNYKRFIYKVAFLSVILIELFIYMKVGLVSRKSLTYPYTLYNEKYKLCEKINDRDFDYRIDGDIISANENLICKKGKVSEFNTMNQKQKFDFFKKSGFLIYSSSVNSFFTYPPLYSSLLGVKYIYTDTPVSYGYEFLYHFFIGQDKYYVYENKNALSIGFAFKEHDYKLPKNYHPFHYQNAFTNYLTGKSVFQPISYEIVDEKTIKMKIDNSYPIYLNYRDRYDLTISIHNEKINTHKEIKNTEDIKQGIVYIENKYENQEVVVTFKEKIDYNHLFLYYLDEKRYEQVISTLKKDPVHITSMKKNILKGEVNLDEDKDILFTIPYSKNYKVLVDGKQVPFFKKFNTFIGFSISKGSHKIEIVYQNHLFYIGLFVSILSLFFIIGIKRIIKVI